MHPAAAAGSELRDIEERDFLETTWDGTTAQRIRIQPFPWRKRRERRASSR